jgi:hypothetical protein
MPSSYSDETPYLSETYLSMGVLFPLKGDRHLQSTFHQGDAVSVDLLNILSLVMLHFTVHADKVTDITDKFNLVQPSAVVITLLETYMGKGHTL